ncbi:hypothetical protein CEP53_004253 [Fusarium sp. AF-6]|nr:hypothetical protein CEP53_004253 [Fusarium sp. AF-6]
MKLFLKSFPQSVQLQSDMPEYHPRAKLRAEAGFISSQLNGHGKRHDSHCSPVSCSSVTAASLGKPV